MLPLQPGKALAAALVGRDGHHLADAEAVGVGNVVGVNNADAYAILRADLLQLIARWTVHVRGWQVAWKAGDCGHAGLLGHASGIARGSNKGGDVGSCNGPAARAAGEAQRTRA